MDDNVNFNKGDSGPAQPYGQVPPQYQPPMPQAGNVPQKSDGQAIASMVLGIVSFVLCYIGFITGIIAIVLANSAIRRIDASGGQLGGRGMAVAGRVLGIVATALYGVILAFVIVAAALGGAA